MSIATQTGFVAYGGGKGLTQGDAYVFDGVVVINVGVAIAVYVQVYQAVAGDLVQHVVQEGDAGIDGLLASAIQIDGNAHARFIGITGNVCCTHNENLISGVKAVAGAGGVGM